MTNEIAWIEPLSVKQRLSRLQAKTAAIWKHKTSHGAPEAHAGLSSAARPGSRRLLPIAGIAVAVVALVGHFGVGAAVMHIGIPAVLAYLGVNLGAGALVVAIAAVISLKLLVAFGAYRWWRQQ